MHSKSRTGLCDVQLIDGGEHADLATTVAFTARKREEKEPVKIARELARELAGTPASNMFRSP